MKYSMKPMSMIVFMNDHQFTILNIYYEIRYVKNKTIATKLVFNVTSFIITIQNLSNKKYG